MGAVGKVVGKITGADQAAKASQQAAGEQAAAQREAIAAQERAFYDIMPGLSQFLHPAYGQPFQQIQQQQAQKQLLEKLPANQRQQYADYFNQQDLARLGMDAGLGAPQQPGQVPGAPGLPSFQPAGGAGAGVQSASRNSLMAQLAKEQQGLAGARGIQRNRYRTRIADIQKQLDALGPAGGGGQAPVAAPPLPGQPGAAPGAPAGPALPGGGAGAGGIGYDPLTQLRAASGALGPEAQSQFYENFQEDPGTAFLREQGLTGIDRGASAQGGLGGGAREKARMQFSQGLANQQLQQRLSQLGGLAQQDIGLATGLANLRTGLGSAQAQGLSNIGAARAQGTQAAGQAGQQGISTLFGGLGAAAGLGWQPFSDRRLKKNIIRIGESNGLPYYIWDWTEDAKHIVGNQPSFGHMADEVAKKYPRAVSRGMDGYLRVDYDLIGEVEHG